MRFTFSTIAPDTRAEVFAWHGRPGAFRRLQPPWMPVNVESEASSLRDGRAVLAFPAGLKWIAQHQASQFVHGRRFVDELVSAGIRTWPLAAVVDWHHIHEFTPYGEAVTLVRDEVETNVPGRLLRPMFTYRREQLISDLEAHRWGRAMGGPLTVAMTGSSGLVGSALAAFLTTGGHRVIRLVRRAPKGPDERRWDPHAPHPALLRGVNALIHLAGAPIAGRFTESHKRQLRGSRVPATRNLAELLAQSREGPDVFLSASAIGYYGPDRGEENLIESSPPGEGFLADLVTDWEAATAPARRAGVRVVNVRTGIVQAAAGGMLARLRHLFAAGLGGKIGSGKQWISWIGLDDLVYIYHRALLDSQLEGPINACAPKPVRNADWTRALAHTLRRPAVLTVPAAGPRVLFGSEGARELASADQCVLPAALLEAGYEFRRPHLGAALRHELGKYHRAPGASAR